jgi:hypothetical protein
MKIQLVSKLFGEVAYGKDRFRKSLGVLEERKHYFFILSQETFTR